MVAHFLNVPPTDRKGRYSRKRSLRFYGIVPSMFALNIPCRDIPCSSPFLRQFRRSDCDNGQRFPAPRYYFRRCNLLYYPSSRQFYCDNGAGERGGDERVDRCRATNRRTLESIRTPEIPGHAFPFLGERMFNFSLPVGKNRRSIARPRDLRFLADGIACIRETVSSIPFDFTPAFPRDCSASLVPRVELFGGVGGKKRGIINGRESY